jgi:flagellar biosynthetic protein FliQ
LTPEFAVQIIRQSLTMALWVAAPLLVVGFVVGIVMSLIQILTSIQDSAFGAIPRLCAFLGAFIVALPWMLNKMMQYTISILGNLNRYAQ